jgi:hypothetical protein
VAGFARPLVLVGNRGSVAFEPGEYTLVSFA